LGIYQSYLPNHVKFAQAETIEEIKEYIKKDIKLEKEREKRYNTKN
jgi:hypothetical protein